MFGYSLDGRKLLRAGRIVREYETRGDAVSAFAKLIRLIHVLAR